MTQGTNALRCMVDQSELRTNQVLAITLLVGGFLLDDWRMVVIQTGIFFMSSVRPWLGLHILLYRFLLKPLGIIKPDLREDNAEAHRFATAIGGLVSALASYFLITGSSMMGWMLVWLIVVLGILAIFGWCAGCFIYYMLHRLGLRGFFRHRPAANTFPGVRPPKP